MRRTAQKSSSPEAAFSEPDAGLYLLIMRLNPPMTTGGGAIGEIVFDRGRYAYCGRARRNLTTRLRRHTARRKRLRRHIDYLTSSGGISIESALIFPPDEMTECGLNALVQAPPHAKPIPGFGCSDCRCVSHPAFLGDNPPDLGVNVLHGRH